jgi:hypothetical protein
MNALSTTPSLEGGGKAGRGWTPVSASLDKSSGRPSVDKAEIWKFCLLPYERHRECTQVACAIPDSARNLTKFAREKATTVSLCLTRTMTVPW